MAKKATDATGSAVAKVMELLKEHSVEYVDLRFTDPRGKWQHTAQHVSTMDEEAFRDGIMFDGSSIAGWKAINESDMILMPDPASAVMDPFAAKPSLILFCDIIEPSTGQPYNRDPRSTAKKAEAHLKASGIGDTAYFGPEAEFFVFDSVKYGTGPNYGIYQLDSIEGPRATWAIARESRAVTSRCRRWTTKATCAPKCCPPWSRWASPPRSTTMRWRPRSTSWR
jgi:glutamine synthetase